MMCFIIYIKKECLQRLHLLNALQAALYMMYDLRSTSILPLRIGFLNVQFIRKLFHRCNMAFVCWTSYVNVNVVNGLSYRLTGIQELILKKYPIFKTVNFCDLFLLV